MMKIDYLKLILSILLCQGIGFLGSLFTGPVVKSAWYVNLQKPVFQPPGWLFGPVWGILFLLMGISLYLILIQNVEFNRKILPLMIFVIQMVLNVLWSYFFFYSKNPEFAFYEIVVLFLFILLTIILFYGINKLSAYLLIPYLLWVGFATLLNFSIWKLN